jgi:hypothetical protein
MANHNDGMCPGFQNRVDKYGDTMPIHPSSSAGANLIG